MDRERRYRIDRRRLVTHLRKKGISNERVLTAIGTVERHRFMEDGFVERSYEDVALPIGQRQTISQPFTVAYQSMLLDPQPGERILEIGLGSGYQAAVLCELGAFVCSIERVYALWQRTDKLLRKLGYKVFTKAGDGTLGWPKWAPFNGIIVTAGASDVPQPLLDQLRIGGRLIIPVGTKRSGQKMLRVVRTGPDAYERETLDTFRFVPLIGEGGGTLT